MRPDYREILYYKRRRFGTSSRGEWGQNYRDAGARSIRKQSSMVWSGITPIRNKVRAILYNRVANIGISANFIAIIQCKMKHMVF